MNFRDRIDPDPVVAFLDGVIVGLILVILAAAVLRFTPPWLP